MNKAAPKTIMGIDPGTNRAGYGVLEVCGNEMRCLVLGDIELGKYKNPYDKLRHLFERVAALVDTYHPDEVAYESPFYGENVQSMLKLGRAQGVAMAAALTRGVPVHEYAPRRVKQAITGNGGASKEQVAALLRSMLKVEYSLRRLDATDGLAVAVCHYFAVSTLAGTCVGTGDTGGGKIPKGGKPQSWESFVAGNPGRVVKPK